MNRQQLIPKDTMAPMTSQDSNKAAAMYCERALRMMETHHILPNPRNYNIFYAYAAGQPTALIEEVNHALTHKHPLSEDFLEHLYTQYIAQDQARAIQETALGARRIIGTVMRGIEDFTGSTLKAGNEIGSQLERLNEIELVERDIRTIAEAVMQGAKVMQQSSVTVNEQLEMAQKEISVLRSNLAKVTTESERDFLTGSYNRKAFDKLMNEALEEAKLENTSLTLIMIDIDHFKKFNDTFGHLIGDEVLKFTAKSIIDTVKGRDLVARFGGEEFAVVLPHTPIDGGMIVAEAIRKNIAGKELKRKSTGEQYGHVTVSLGVSSFRTGDTTYHLIKRADEALYQSKRLGRDRVTRESFGE